MPLAVRMMDNAIDVSRFPLPATPPPVDLAPPQAPALGEAQVDMVQPQPAAQ